MTSKTIKVGQTSLKHNSQSVGGGFVDIDGEGYYKISNYDQMSAFYISLVSHSDHWLYISSLGGLSAGRKNPENALFPYYTDDKIHDSGDVTGSKTIFIVTKDDQDYLWEPFSDRYAGLYALQRNLYKNTYGNKLIFEEINKDLGLSFSYSWNFSELYGFIKKSKIQSRDASKLNIRILDGLQNILPYGVNLKMQLERSTLLDAYKKNELLEDSNLGLFLLSSVPVDKAEPSEALKATTVWHTGLNPHTQLLSSNQLNNFRRGEKLSPETDIRAERGAYFIESSLDLSQEDSKTWYFVADINQGPSDAFATHDFIQNRNDISTLLQADIDQGTNDLINIVGASDGLQKSTDELLTTRHFANVLFNVMRGGTFDNHYNFPKTDLHKFIQQSNTNVAARHDSFFQSLPDDVNYTTFKNAAAQNNDQELNRLCLEYLPLTFSRRHGDPSRPWNRFSIELHDELGQKKFYYQGNWRDIFQNWEALSLSYPEYLESMISKFVNASTLDGYNPYRITRDGIDWELIDEDDPWVYIGYWGDHQIIYLLKLMEISNAHHPGAIESMLIQKEYTYANVPYRIKDYDELLSNPHDTIIFDHDLQSEIEKRTEILGADGKLVYDNQGQITYVNFAEKILLCLFTKLSNFIPEGGYMAKYSAP